LGIGLFCRRSGWFNGACNEFHQHPGSTSDVALFPEARNSFFGNIEYLVSLESSLQAVSNNVFGLFVEITEMPFTAIP